MIKKEKKRRRWWRTELYRKRVGNELMQDLKFQHDIIKILQECLLQTLTNY
jgi:hypothetical protein